jgi:hypothetical protein
VGLERGGCQNCFPYFTKPDYEESQIFGGVPTDEGYGSIEGKLGGGDLSESFGEKITRTFSGSFGSFGSLGFGENFKENYGNFGHNDQSDSRDYPMFDEDEDRDEISTS